MNGGMDRWIYRHITDFCVYYMPNNAVPQELVWETALGPREYPDGDR